ncbi:hypothetical protein V8F33_003637 [Rhypophila sp. PSN 637]
MIRSSWTCSGWLSVCCVFQVHVNQRPHPALSRQCLFLCQLVSVWYVWGAGDNKQSTKSGLSCWSWLPLLVLFLLWVNVRSLASFLLVFFRWSAQANFIVSSS